jgi:hypothetical protein
LKGEGLAITTVNSIVVIRKSGPRLANQDGAERHRACIRSGGSPLCRTRVETRQSVGWTFVLYACPPLVLINAVLTQAQAACRAAVYPRYCPGYVGSRPVTSRNCGLCPPPPLSHRVELGWLAYPRPVRLRSCDHCYRSVRVGYKFCVTK